MGNARGEVELDGKVLVLKRIHVTYTGFALADADRTTVQRVLDTHMQGCPVARSIGAAIDITTSVVIGITTLRVGREPSPGPR